MAKSVEEILQRHPGAGRDHLIPILQEVQEEEGYLSQGAIVRIGQELSLPASKIYGVATFYNQFRLVAPGKFVVRVCRGTACHVKGSALLLEKLVQELKIQPGQTTRDGLFSIETVACIGACSIAPVVAVNNEFHGRVEPKEVPRILSQYRKLEEKKS